MTNREMRNLWLTLLGKGVSQMGSKLFGFAMSFYILKTTGSAQSFAISLLITTLPGVFLSPLAGGLTDRIDKKLAVVGADLLSGLSMIAIFFVIQSESLTLTMIYLAEFILAVLFVFLNNAFSASYPNIVSKENLTKINAYSQGLDSVLSIFIPLLGGIVYGLIDVKLFFVINGISFILSAVSEMFIDFHMFGRRVVMKVPFVQNLKEGFNYISKQKLFMTIAIYALFINFFMSAFSIILPYNLITLHEVTPETNGMIQSVFPIGAIVMSVYIGKKNTKFSNQLLRNTMMMFGLLMFCFALPTMGIFELGWLMPFYYALLMGVMAMVSILVNVPLQVLFQTIIEDAYRGRAMGVLSAFAQGIMPISYLLTGILIDYIPSYSILLFSALAMMTIAISVHKNVHLKEVAA
ncbi:MAG TPA: hypothetical protein DCS67_01455 [Clostridiales bacterium UBA8960]|jgi:MFS family permease|nr:hypothetical protein [Clostridiales bacterium UBA8960]